MNLFIKFFNCGTLLNRENIYRCDYYVQDKNNIIKHIIPHFTISNLENQKQLDCFGI